MGVASGFGGTVNGEQTVRSWSIQESAESQAFGASNTAQATGRKTGHKDWSGSFNVYGHTPSVMPGDTFTFTGWGPQGKTGQAIVDSIEVNWDIEGGGIIEATVNFSGNGALSDTTTQISDGSTPDPPSAVGTKAELDTTELDDVRSMSLTITADNHAYTSSSTGGWTKRLAGRLDASGSIDFYSDDLTGLPESGTFKQIALYVDATQKWDLKWGHIDSIEPDVNIESGEPVGVTLNFSFSGFNGGQQGSIEKPGGNAIWP